MTAARPSCDMSTATSLELVRCLKKTCMMRPLSSLKSGLSLRAQTSSSAAGKLKLHHKISDNDIQPEFCLCKYQ